MSFTPSGSYTLSAFAYTRFPEPCGERFDGDFPFRPECSGVSQFLQSHCNLSLGWFPPSLCHTFLPHSDKLVLVTSLKINHCKFYTEETFTNGPQSWIFWIYKTFMSVVLQCHGYNINNNILNYYFIKKVVHHRDYKSNWVETETIVCVLWN